MSPEHQIVADRLHEEARCLSWRNLLLADRIGELVKEQLGTELALMRYADNDAICAGVIRLRELIDRAGELCVQGELDYADDACERSERALIDLRTLARSCGAA
jgi:hypothetical protein